MQIEKKPIDNANWAYVLNHLPPIDLVTGPWIAGGSARRLWLNQDWRVGDIDVFFSDDLSRRMWYKKLHECWTLVDEESITEHQTVFSTLHLLQDAAQKPSKPNAKYRWIDVVIDTDNATTLELQWSEGKDQEHHRVALQLIKVRYSNTILELWRDFDFTISCFAASADQVWALKSAVQDGHNNQIQINNAEQLQNLALRLVKHHAQGFKIDDQLLLEAVDLIARGEYQCTAQY
jgi:hypothetical protein